jgi:hypothetical protein
MFYIQINGKRVNLGDDFRIDLVIENPLFLTERIPFPYTTSADLPMTPENKQLLQQAQRVNLTAAGRKWEYDGAILGFGARPLFYGLFIIQEIRQRFSWSFQASDDLSQIRSNMNKIEWGEILFGSGTYAMRTDPGWNPTGGTTDIPLILYRNQWNLSRDGELPYTTAPIKTSDAGIPTKFTEDDILVYTNGLFAQNNFFNPWSNIAGNLVPVDYDPLTTIVSRYAHSPMYPQLRAYYVCKKLLGLADADNPFYQEDLYRIVLTSHYHPKFRDDLIQKWSGILLDNEYPSNLSPAETWILKLASYQPALSAAEVLKSLLNIVAGTVFRYQEPGQAIYKIKMAKDIIADMDFQDWDKLLGTKLWLSREKGQPYLYGYDDFDEEDPAIDPEFVVNTIADLLTAPVDPETNERPYYVQTTKQIILKKLAPKFEASDPDVFVYEVRHSGLARPQADTGYQITSSLSPMPMLPTVNVDLFHSTQAAPNTMAYMPIYSGGKSVSYKPHLMQYWGNIENPLNPPFQMPYLSYHNYTAGGSRLGDLSLQWDGPDGLLEHFHKDFKLWVERDKLVGYGEFIFSPYFLRDIDLAKKILVRNRLWWIKKIVIPMSKKKINPAQVDLIESQDPQPEPGAGSSGQGSSPDLGSSPTPMDPTGTCFTISIDNLVFDDQADDFDIRIQRPGESLITQNYNLFQQFEDGSTTLILVCSEIFPAFVQNGETVASVPGVSLAAGGACTIDGDCSL